MKPDKKLYLYLALVVAETFVIFWFSFLPGVDFVETGVFRLGDLEHFIAYGVYGFLLSRVLRYFVKGWKVVLVSIVIGSAVGGLSEGVQFLLPYRVGDAIDWGVDALGSFVGAMAGVKFKPSSQIN
jgi:VanZ family protein